MYIILPIGQTTIEPETRNNGIGTNYIGNLVFFTRE